MNTSWRVYSCMIIIIVDSVRWYNQNFFLFNLHRLTFPLLEVATTQQYYTIHKIRGRCKEGTLCWLVLCLQITSQWGDAGGEYNGYGTDITRTFPVDGTWTEAQTQIYQLVLDVQKGGIEMVWSSDLLLTVFSWSQVLIGRRCRMLRPWEYAKDCCRHGFAGILWQHLARIASRRIEWSHSEKP